VTYGYATHTYTLPNKLLRQHCTNAYKYRMKHLLTALQADYLNSMWF